MENAQPVVEQKQGFPTKLVLGACCGCLALVLIAVALLGGGIYLGVTQMTAPAEATVATFLSRMGAGDADGAYTTFSRGMKAAKPVEWLKAKVTDGPDLFKVVPEGPSYSNRKINNGVVYLRGSYATTSGKTYYCKFTLVREGEPYRIEELAINEQDFPPEKDE